MKLFMQVYKALSSLFCLLAILCCFSVSLSAQSTSSTGQPFGDWEGEKVCYRNNGVDSTLTKLTLVGDGQTSNLIQSTRYIDAYNNEIVPDTVNGTIVYGMCGGVALNTDTIQHFIVEEDLCDFNDALVDPYFAFKRVFVLEFNTNTDSVSTLSINDFSYTGAKYTPAGQIGIGLCAETDSLAGQIDYEYFRECMIDSIDLTTQVEFIRVFRYADTVKTWIDVIPETYESYTLVGAVQKRCDSGVNGIVDVEKLCNAVVVNVDFAISAEYKGNNIVAYTVTTPIGDRIAVTNYTLDCGNGQRFTDRQFVDCQCDYRNDPDGTYSLTASLDLANGGQANQTIDRYTIRDGRIYQGAGTDLLSGTWNIATVTFIDINLTTTPFYKVWYANGDIKNVNLDGSDYTPTGTVKEDCKNDDLYYTQTYEPSTRTTQELISNECYEKSIPSGGNTWSITATITDLSGANYNNIENLDNLQFNGATLPLFYPYNIGGFYDEDRFITDLQNYLIANNISYGSVSYDNGFIVINALDPAITTVTSTSTGVNAIGAAYTGDTTLLLSVTRWAENGLEKITMNHFGKETRLPIGDPSLKRVSCGGGSSDDGSCDDLLRLTHTQRYTDTIIVFAANTIFSYDIKSVIGEPIVTQGTDNPTTYPSWYGNAFDLPRCYKIANTITIDLTGKEGMVSWIE